MKKQTMKEVTELDKTFQDYLKKARDYDRKTEERKLIRAEMDILDKKLAPFLIKLENQKQTFNIKAELCDVYGKCLGLQLVPYAPQTYLNKEIAYKSLLQFYTNKFPSESKEDLKKFANASVVFIWQNKEKKEKKLRVKILYHKDAKKNKKSIQQEEEEEEDDEEDSDE